MSQAIISLPSVTAAYFRQVGPYGPSIGLLWKELHEWAGPRKIWTDSTVSYGISHDNPMNTPPEQCRYDACVEVPKDMVIDGGASRAELPGGLYARVAFHAVPTEIPKAFDQLFQQIIPQAKKQFDFTRPCFELYKGITEMGPDGSFSCDICVPVK